MINFTIKLDRFSLGQKVLALIFVNVFAFVIVAFIASKQITKVNNRAVETSDLYISLDRTFTNINLLSDVYIKTTQQIYANSSEIDFQDQLGTYERLSKQFNDELQKIERYLITKNNQPSKQTDIAAMLADQLLPSIRDTKLAFLKMDVQTRKTIQQVYAGDLLENQIEFNQTFFDNELAGFTFVYENVRRKLIENGLKTKRVAIGYTVLSAILSVIFVVVFLWLVVRQNISKPLHSLTDTINAFNALGKVEESDFELSLLDRGDELGRISRSFNRLKHNLWAQRTALQDAKDTAEHANQAKSQFLAAASHDLRQPLHAMQMYISALRGVTTNEKALAIVEDIDAVSISTAGLLNALLDVSQLEAGVIEPNYVDFPVQEILHRVARSFGPIAEQKNLNLRVVDTSAYVHGDPVLLERIIGNFTSNAVRYTVKGSILIGCRHKADKISIEVLDTGPGIPEEEQSAIFEDFHQLENKERDRGKGLGLGLAIVRRLSVRIGNEIDHDSIVGRGSRFAVLVPKVDAPAVVDKAVPTLDENFSNFDGVSVLLIEDDPSVLDASLQLMTSWGCDVLTATSMDEAMAVLMNRETMAPDIIVADYRLPGGSTGVEVATHLQLMLGHAVPVVIVTGDVANNQMRDIADQGYRVLSKPVRPAKLRAIISHLLRS